MQSEAQMKTLAYYAEHAEEFVSNTKDVDFSEIQNAFLSYLPPEGTILDLGCGSGRDSKAFIDKGYKVVAVDGSEELCKSASQFIGQPVICSTFQEYTPEISFDGIWACASLLHLNSKDEVASVVTRMANHLKPGGCFYASFKYGDFSGERNGRYFTDMTETFLTEMVREIPSLRIDRLHITTDVRPGRDDEKWVNAFLIKN